MEGVNSRFNEILKTVCGGNKSRMANSIGISEGSVRSYCEGRELNLTAVTGICKNFGVRADWLLFGEGNPFVDNEEGESASYIDSKSNADLIQTIKSLQEQNALLQNKLLSLI